ncbi:MAG: dihydroorotate dehydrogenase electron transfer subunit [bacterium]
MSITHRCRVVQQKKLGDGIFVLRLEMQLTAPPLPGNFVHIKVNSETDPLLRRPFSIYDYDLSTGVVDVLYKVFGRGTRILAQAHAGDYLDVLGPLGNSFADLQHEQNLILVGGGVGIPPLYLLAKQACANGHQPQIKFLCGLASAAEKPLAERLQQLPVTLEYSTDDGSLGYHGLVTDLLAQELLGNTDAVIASCGPPGMLREVQRLCREHKVRGYLSLESIMPCGVGTCLGCVVREANGPGYRRVCREGPVFSTEEVQL